MSFFIKILSTMLIPIELICQNYEICKKYTFHDTFYYEYSEQFKSLDDMIFRKKAILFASKSITYKEIFLFENGFEHNELIKECEVDSLSNNELYGITNFLNDSIHNILDSINTNIVTNRNGLNYKVYNLKFEAIFLGDQLISFNHKNKRIQNIMIPTFLIIRFLDIKPN